MARGSVPLFVRRAAHASRSTVEAGPDKIDTAADAPAFQRTIRAAPAG